MNEEIGVTLDQTCVVSLRHGAYSDGRRWHEHYCCWPLLDDDFVLTEGQRYAWLTLEEALNRSDLADYAREALTIFRTRLCLDDSS